MTGNGHGTQRQGTFRVDLDLGIHEFVDFFGSDSALFGCLHLPHEVQGAALLCPSICADLEINYRTEVLLSRFLASRGIAVQRFQYRGTGNSHGDPSAVSFPAMREAALVAMDHLLGRVPAGVPLTLLGARWGGMVAASLTSASEHPSLVLWEPVLDSGQYLDEVSRVKMVHDMRVGTSRGDSRDFLENLRSSGMLDVMGYPVYGHFYDSCQGIRLTSEIGINTRRALLVQAGTASTLRQDYQSLLDDLSEKGVPTATVIVDNWDSWWFQGQHQLRSESLAESLAERIGSWLSVEVDI